MKKVHVRLGDRSYDICIGKGILKEAGALAQKLALGQKGAILCDSNTGPLYAEKVKQSFSDAGFDMHLIEVPAGENSKSLETAHQIWKTCLGKGLDRSSFIATLGGGVVGDLGGFIAATYMRGIPFIQIPTTLLAQVDSSVGGKVGINLPEGKNLIGSFYQPRLVLIDVDVLSTLPEREFRAGMAEVIKYGIIWDKSFFHYLEKHLDEIFQLKETPLVNAIAKSCEIKALVVEMDEKELGMRAVLNFGHTFGHAYEAAEGYRDLRHGEAIAVGMIAAAKLSSLLKLCPEEVAQSIHTLIERTQLPTRLSGLSIDSVKSHMKVDKKAAAGKLKFVLTESIGKVVVLNEVNENDIDTVLKDSLSNA